MLESSFSNPFVGVVVTVAVVDDVGATVVDGCVIAEVEVDAVAAATVVAIAAQVVQQR